MNSKQVKTGFYAAAIALVLPVSALADSCWDHNGSLMRLVANGKQRAFFYEVPRQAMRNEGVTPGTLLFDGVTDGGRYSGTARVFSRHCPGVPLEYRVEGPIDRNQTRVTVSGDRQAYKRCQPTDDWKRDTLVFIYSHQC